MTHHTWWPNRPEVSWRVSLKTLLFSLYLVTFFPVLCSGHLLTLTVWLNDLSLRCAESDGWHRQKHQQLFQNIPRAELPVKLYNLYQPCSRQDWGPLPWNWQNGLLQVNWHPKSWLLFSVLIFSISNFILSAKVVTPATVYSQVDWLHYSLLHGCSGTGIQLPGPALRHPGIRQARLTDNTRLHLQHGRNDAYRVSRLPGFKL